MGWVFLLFCYGLELSQLSSSSLITPGLGSLVIVTNHISINMNHKVFISMSIEFAIAVTLFQFIHANP
jgi:hypothetical protein